MKFNKGQKLLAGALLALAPMFVYADDSSKVHQIGIASFATAVDYDNPFYADDAFAGMGLFYTGAVNNNVGLRFGLFGGDYEGDDLGLTNAEMSGHELSILFGGNLQDVGFKGYVGLGFFSEEWENNGATQDFNGSQVTFGIGYNLEQIAFDLWVSARDAGDYEDYWGSTASASSAGLMVSARF